MEFNMNFSQKLQSKDEQSLLHKRTNSSKIGFQHPSSKHNLHSSTPKKNNKSIKLRGQSSSPRLKPSKRLITCQPFPKSPKININMEIKNLNIYGTQAKSKKKLHKKTISLLPRNNENKEKPSKVVASSGKVKKHHKTKSQENIKTQSFEWGSFLAKTNKQEKGIVSKYAFCNRGGKAFEKKNKTNQDSYILFQNFLVKGRYLFGVCDGHGVNGHYVSKFVKEILPQNLQYFFLKNKAIHKTSSLLIQSSLKQAFNKTARNLNQSGIDIMFSGSTTCLAYCTQSAVHCANLGDSRAVIFSKTDQKWFEKQLSYDHKAQDQKQRVRIKMNGGRVFPYRDEKGQQLGPYRVWVKNQNIPGLAMTRSFGDYVASTVGVISEPQIINHKVNKEDKFMVIATDGLWQFISNQEVLNIVNPAYIRNDAEQAVKLLENAAVKAWQKQDENIDDITIIIVFFKYY